MSEATPLMSRSNSETNLQQLVTTSNKCYRFLWEDLFSTGGFAASSLTGIKAYLIDHDKTTTIVCSVIAVVMILFLVRVRLLRPPKTIEEQITALKKEKSALNKEKNEFEGRLRELQRTKTEVEQEAALLRENEQVQLRELNAVQDKLHSTVEKFEAVQALYSAYKEKTEAFLQRLQAVKRGEEALDDQLEDMEVGESLGEFTQEARLINEKLESFRQELDEIRQMKQTIIALKVQADSIKNSANQFHEDSERVEQLTQMLKQLFETE